MNKAELIAAVAAEAGVSKKEADAVVKALTCVVKAELQKKEGKVQLPEIGTFKVAERAARTVRNPRTGETMESKACKVPKFTAAKALKEAVNTKKKCCKKK